MMKIVKMYQLLQTMEVANSKPVNLAKEEGGGEGRRRRKERDILGLLKTGITKYLMKSEKKKPHILIIRSISRISFSIRM